MNSYQFRNFSSNNQHVFKMLSSTTICKKTWQSKKSSSLATHVYLVIYIFSTIRAILWNTLKESEGNIDLKYYTFLLSCLLETTGNAFVALLLEHFKMKNARVNFLDVFKIFERTQNLTDLQSGKTFPAFKNVGTLITVIDKPDTFSRRREEKTAGKREIKWILEQICAENGTKKTLFFLLRLYF